MSSPFPRDPNNPLALVPFTEELLDEVSTSALHSPRRRSIIRLHEHGDAVQRMFNALQTNSYARPHQHSDPDKVEVFIALRGTLLVVSYDANGTPIEGVVLKESGPVRGVEIPAGAWHSVIALEDPTVVFEVLEGPYDPATHKRFAAWAPPEEDQEGGLAYMAGVLAHFAPTIPEVAAHRPISAAD